MRIAVNTRLLINDIHGGIEWFSYECLKRICKGHPEHEFIFLFDRPYDKKFIFSSNIEPLVVKPATIHPLFWYIWLEYKLPPVLRKKGADLFLSPDGMMPLRTNIPCIPVIHDINFYHRSSDLPHLKSLYYRKYFKQYAMRARRVVTVSEYSKQDMVRSWGIKSGKIDVVYNGVADEFSCSEGAKDTRDTKPYFLFVGNLSPRKNTAGLILAYERYRKELKGAADLVIAGDRLFMNRRNRQNIYELRL
ncbi:MAG: glycosyltransferase [Bacteroidales bacterium]|nr:glycosyltransferase [Bacteroidales bacterium]